MGRLTTDERARIAAVVARVTTAQRSLAGALPLTPPGPEPAADGPPETPGPLTPPVDPGPSGPLAGSWLLDDQTGKPMSLADFDAVRRFKLRGCSATFWFAKTETVLAQLLAQGVSPGVVFLEDELVRTLLTPGLSEAALREIATVKQGFDGEVVRASTSGPKRALAWPKPRITYGRSRAGPVREPGDETGVEDAGLA